MTRIHPAWSAKRIAVAAIAVLTLTCGTRAADWDAGGGEPWQRLLASARQEGPAVLSACSGVDASFVLAFKRDTGLDLVVATGLTADLAARFRTELIAGRVTTDIRLSGPEAIELVAGGYLADLPEKLVLPDARDQGKWMGQAHAYVDDGKRFMVIGAQYVNSRFLINRGLVDPNSIKSIQDLLKPEFRGKIASSDPTVPGPGQAMASYFAWAKGMDFVKTLFGTQNIAFSRDAGQLVEWVARGIYPIALGVEPATLERFRRQGVAALAIVNPADATGSLVAGCSIVAVPKGAPHPATAAVFVNWYLSRNGQQALVEAIQLPSRRTDVPHDGVATGLLPEPNTEYLDQAKADWYLGTRPGLLAELRKVLDK